jgi:hypothetical protein
LTQPLFDGESSVEIAGLIPYQLRVRIFAIRAAGEVVEDSFRPGSIRAGGQLKHRATSFRAGGGTAVARSAIKIACSVPNQTGAGFACIRWPPLKVVKHGLVPRSMRPRARLIDDSTAAVARPRPAFPSCTVKIDARCVPDRVRERIKPVRAFAEGVEHFLRACLASSRERKQSEKEGRYSHKLDDKISATTHNSLLRQNRIDAKVRPHRGGRLVGAKASV